MDRRAAVLISALSLAACGGPSTHAWLPAGSDVPDAEDDPTIASAIDENDGVERMVPRVGAFAEGVHVWYWHLGLVETDATMPLHRLCRRMGAGSCLPIDHPYVVGALPGDEGYSHYGRVHDVEVTAAYAGEIFPTREAIDDAVRDGLALAPVETDRWLSCPIVHRDVRIEVAAGETAAPVPIYARGLEARCLDFAPTHGTRALHDGAVLVRNVYLLTRDGEDAPLHEGARGEDLSGDGDTNDTNNVFGVGFTNGSYTPLWRLVTVTVPAAYASIDTAMDETMATYRAGTEMFTVDPETYEITPMAGRVVAHEETDTLIDCPIQSAAGTL